MMIDLVQKKTKTLAPFLSLSLCFFESTSVLCLFIVYAKTTTTTTNLYSLFVFLFRSLLFVYKYIYIYTYTYVFINYSVPETNKTINRNWYGIYKYRLATCDT